MIMKKLLFASTLALLSCAAQDVFAAGAVMCFPDVAVGPPGPRAVYNPQVAGSTQVGESANSPYILNGQGCSYIYSIDIGWANSQGASYGSQTGAIVYQTGVLTGTTALQIGTLPPNTFISSIVLDNVTANAAGNLSFGNVSAGAQFVSVFTLAASTVVVIPQASMVLQVIATAPTLVPYNVASQPLFVNSSAWGSANVGITVTYQYF